MTLRLAVFASGSGTNFQALFDRFNRRDDAAATVALLVTDRDEAGANARASAAGVPATVIPAAGRPPADIAAEMLTLLEHHAIDAVALAGYLRLVPEPVVAAFRGRMLNIHPALLPSFGGKGMYGARVHRAVLDAGCLITGATVHYVDERYDEGRTLAQWPVPVLRGDTVDSLAARVLRVEHALYPAGIELLARTLEVGTAPPEGFDHRSGLLGFSWTPDAEVQERDIRRTFGLD